MAYQNYFEQDLADFESKLAEAAEHIADLRKKMVEGKRTAVYCQLRPATLEALRKLLAISGAKTFGDLLSRRYMQKWFTSFARKAGAPGSIKTLRKTAATWIEVQHPGSSSRFLGHKTPGLNHKHYLDPRFLDQNRPLPPEIDSE